MYSYNLGVNVCQNVDDFLNNTRLKFPELLLIDIFNNNLVKIYIKLENYQISIGDLQVLHKQVWGAGILFLVTNGAGGIL